MTQNKGTMAITMAGFGSRFAAAGYMQPKYQIMARDHYLFDWSMMALAAFRDAQWRFRFAVRRDDGAAAFIQARCEALQIDCAGLIELDAPTDGQATTARILADASDPDAPFAVFNIDTFVRPHAMTPQAIPADCDGWIPCFPGPGDGWSFARVDDTDRALELREKVRISPHATVGFYWFRTARYYAASYDTFFKDGAGEEKGEKYIAPLYNHLIGQGDRVRIQRLALGDIGMLGTPAQVASFQDAMPDSAVQALSLWGA